MMKIKYLLFSIFLFAYSSLIAQSSGFVPAKSVKTYYQTFGTGEPLLLINGGPGFSSEGFVPLAKKLSITHQVIIYDQRGTGKSTLERSDNSTITLDLMIEDIENLRKHLKIKEWTVMGHSFGGMLASYYATKHPDVITKMIMSSSGGVDLDLLSGAGILAQLTAAERDSIDVWDDKIRQGDQSDAARLKRATFLASAYVYDKNHIPVVAERLTQGDMSLNRVVWLDMRRIGFDCKADLKNYQKPVLILQGKNDVLGLNIAETIQKTFPKSKLVLLDECGHYGWLDQPQEYFGEINSFLGRETKF